MCLGLVGACHTAGTPARRSEACHLPGSTSARHRVAVVKTAATPTADQQPRGHSATQTDSVDLATSTCRLGGNRAQDLPPPTPWYLGACRTLGRTSALLLVSVIVTSMSRSRLK